MTYKELEKLTEGKTFPICGTNEDGENVIIEHGYNEEWSGGKFFKLTTAQHNGWMRTNYIFEDGTVEELYKK